jgi:hypothetical protein
MNTRSLALTLFIPLVLVGCGGVEGTYKLDKSDTRKSMEADIAKLPADQQKFAQVGLTMVDSMDVTVELKSGGVAAMNSTMPNPFDKSAAAKTEQATGTWKKDGDTITIAEDGKPGKDLKCTKAGAKLTCTPASPPKSGSSPTMVFVKS